MTITPNHNDQINLKHPKSIYLNHQRPRLELGHIMELRSALCSPFHVPSKTSFFFNYFCLYTNTHSTHQEQSIWMLILFTPSSLDKSIPEEVTDIDREKAAWGICDYDKRNPNLFTQIFSPTVIQWSRVRWFVRLPPRMNLDRDQRFSLRNY